MKTDFLVLPFVDDIRKTSIFDQLTYNSNADKRFRIFCPTDELLPFFAPVESIDCKFTLIVKDFTGETVATIKSTQIKHKIVNRGNKKYIMFNGGKVNCLEFGSCKSKYNITIGNWKSEWFWVGDTSKMIKFEFSNSQDFLDVPYSLGFKQYFWVDTKFGTSEIETFKNSVRDDRGETTVKYQRMTEVFTFFFFAVPAHIKQVFASVESLDYFRITSDEQQVISLQKQSTIKPKRNERGFSLFDIELTIPSDRETELSYCEEPFFTIDSVFKGVEVPSNEECISNNVILDYEVSCIDEEEDVTILWTINY